MEELMYLYTHIDLFLFVFIRIVCALILLPIVEESKMPPLALGGISVVLAYATVAVIPSDQLIYQPTLVGFAAIAVKEAIIGLMIGFGMKIFFLVYHFVGMLLGMQGGLSMSTMFDPSSSEQVSILGKFYALGFSMVFIISGGYHWFIKTLVECFKYIPINEAVFRPNIVGAITDAVSDYWLISFKLTIPILAVLFIIDCGLGILARAVPQMNMFVIGIPLKMIVLFMLLIFSIGLFPIFNKMITDNMTNTVMNILQGMMP